jgi:HK97 family phage prohead protease
MPITDFPEQGGDSRVSLQASRFPLFPVAEAQALKDEWPEIWDRGGNILGDTQFNRLAPMARDRRVPETETEEEAVRLREAWAARHLGDFRLAGVVAQIKWLVVGSRGLDHMRQVIMDEKERLRAKSIMDAPLSIKDGKASFVMTSDALDRQGEVVEMDGWEFGNFMRNPVILDTHRYESIEDIVGRAVGEPRREGSGWVVDIEFAPTERGKTAKELVERGMLNAVSVGFRSMQRRKVGSAIHHVKKELLEVSLVAIPANPTALRVKMNDGEEPQEAGMDQMEDDKGGHDKEPRVKNEQMMELRDHLVAAAALVDAMLEGYDEGEEEEMPEDEAPMVEDSAKTGGAGQESVTSVNLVEALSAAMAAIKGV